MDATDLTDPTKVSNEYLHAIIFPTKRKRQEFQHLIDDCQTDALGTMECMINLADLFKATNLTILKAQTWHILFIQIQYPKIKQWHTYKCSGHMPTKGCPESVRLTIGRDKVHYPGQVTTQTADLTTVKLNLNSVVSMPNENFLV